jgi:hypothetical protein
MQEAATAAMFKTLTEEIIAFPDKVNYGVPELELELIKAAEGAMQAGLDAAIAGSAAWVKIPRPSAPALVESLPDDMPVADLRAGLDLLAASRHVFEHAVEAGAALHKDEAREQVGKIDGTVFATLRHLPRRFVAEVAAVRETQGQEAARARLKELIESDILPVIKQGANREKNRTE